jgi:hypothetical protein
MEQSAREPCHLGVNDATGSCVEQNLKKTFQYYEHSTKGGCSQGMSHFG